MRVFQVDKLEVNVLKSNALLGERAADLVEWAIRDAIAEKGSARVVFASAPSQNTFIEAIRKRPIQWEKVTAFDQDEYLGATLNDAHSFGKYLHDRLFSQVPVGQVHYLNGVAEDMQAEFARYARLIQQAPIDVICLGVGENGHIAFNEPHEADFNDPLFIKRITLDEKCRVQQFHDFGFKTIEDVPQYGLTLTISAVMSCNRLVCIVPGERKAQAIQAALENEVSTSCPASVMRRHEKATLILDNESARLLKNQ